MKNNRDSLWIVVEVESGIAVEVKSYQTESAATRRISYRLKRLNPDDDDIQAFRVRLKPS